MRFLVILLLVGCGPRTVQDVQEEGRSLQRTLVKELREVHSLDDLQTRVPRLRRTFDRLSEVMVEGAKKFPNAEVKAVGGKWSDALREELVRIYDLEGAQEVMEELQRPALNRLDLYAEQRKQARERLR